MEELKLDIEELKSLLSQATRPKVQEQISLLVRRLESDLILQEEKQMASLNPDCTETDTKPQLVRKQPEANRVYNVEIKTYCHDQTDKFFKLYVSENMEGVGDLEKDKVTATFTDRSFRLSVRGLKSRNYELHIARLCEPIIPNESKVKIKPNQIIIMLRKQSQTNWAGVTEADKKVQLKKEAAKNPPKDTEDPGAGLMSLMRQMYEDGDDEMKRTIAKAWTESQDKRAAGVE